MSSSTPDSAVPVDSSTVDDPDPGADRPRWRVVAGRVTTGLAALFVLAVLVLPNEFSQLTPGAFVRIPIEALVGVALVLVLRGRARTIVAVVGGLLLGLLTIVKFFDIGFFAVLDRPFDPVADWSFLTAGADYLDRSFGPFGEFGAVAGAVLLGVVVLGLMTLSVLRLTRVAVAHRGVAIRTVAGLTVVWVACAAFGVQLVPGLPVADRSESALAYDHAQQTRADVIDHNTFAAQVADDAFKDTPGADLLTALRGKDVILAYVESYGRVALQDPGIAPGVDATLDAGNQELTAAGFSSRSAFLTSSTYAGGSWLAHSTVESGMWINSQARYKDLVASNRLTLTGTFKKAGWRTVAVMPANTEAWPEQAFFGDDALYDDRNLGYRGQRYTFNSMADQYTLGAFQRAERSTPGHPPVMAQIVLLSSHSPWSPTPNLIGWNDIGVGYGFTVAPEPSGEPDDLLSRTPDQLHADYGRTIQYSLSTLVSYIKTYGDDNLVVVFLGDHQPAADISGNTDNRDAPVTIVAKDPAVLDRVSSWGWDNGLRPSLQAPVWRMDTFRDRFLTAFGPSGGPVAAPPPPAR
jgi:Sulfatase